MIVATLALALTLAVPAPLDFKGKWNASSRNHATAHGAMELGDKTIAFEKLGEFHYTLLEERPGAWILQVDRNVLALLSPLVPSYDTRLEAIELFFICHGSDLLRTKTPAPTLPDLCDPFQRLAGLRSGYSSACVFTARHSRYKTSATNQF